MATAAELIAQAQVAETFSELDAIEVQANGRVTVLGAVADRRTQLMMEQNTMTTTEPTPPPTEPAPAATEPVAAPEKPDYKALATEAASKPPVPTVPGNLYFNYTKPDGGTVLGSAAMAESYLRKGFTISGEETIDDLVTYYAEKAKADAAAAPAPAPAPAP